jgi:arylsulfatase A-like enzyme
MYEQIDVFLGCLEAEGYLDNAIVVFTSDHGEEFDDHGLLFHGQTVYNEVCHVPLVFWAPGEFASTKIDRPVNNVSLYLTLASYLGLSDPPDYLQGEPLLNGLPEGSPEPNFSHCGLTRDDEAISMYAVNGDGWRYVEQVREKGGAFVSIEKELYLTYSDPGERFDMLSNNPELAEAGSAYLSEYYMRLPVIETDEESVEPDKELADELKGLGYF